MKMFGLLLLCTMGFSVEASQFYRNKTLSKVACQKKPPYFLELFNDFVAYRLKKNGKLDMDKIRKDIHKLPDEVLKAYITYAQRNERMQKNKK